MTDYKSTDCWDCIFYDNCRSRKGSLITSLEDKHYNNDTYSMNYKSSTMIYKALDSSFIRTKLACVSFIEEHDLYEDKFFRHLLSRDWKN